jgi:hypothetical protein
MHHPINSPWLSTQIILRIQVMQFLIIWLPPIPLLDPLFYVPIFLWKCCSQSPSKYVLPCSTEYTKVCLCMKLSSLTQTKQVKLHIKAFLLCKRALERGRVGWFFRQVGPTHIKRVHFRETRYKKLVGAVNRTGLALQSAISHGLLVQLCCRLCNILH